MTATSGAEGTKAAAPLSCPKVETLTQRADFLRAARARRASRPAFILQALPREDQSGPVRLGFTCSRKVGNAVARNRAKRRLREAARAVLFKKGHPGWDYVLIGRKDATAERPFDLLVADLEKALTQVHR